MNGLKPFARLIERTSRASIFFIYYFLPVIVSKPRIRTVNARSASDEAIQASRVALDCFACARNDEFS